MSPPPGRYAQGSTRAKSPRKHSHRPTFSDAVSGAFGKAKREANKKQNQSEQPPRNTSMLPIGTIPPVPLLHLAFGTGLTFYMPPSPLNRGPDNMLSSPLGKHILDYEPPRGFVILAFTMVDGSADPYDHMLHYNQVMTLNASNDCLLCKVFRASLRGPTLAWFYKLPHNSIIHLMNFGVCSSRSIFVWCVKRGISTPCKLS